MKRLRWKKARSNKKGTRRISDEEGRGIMQHETEQGVSIRYRRNLSELTGYVSQIEKL